MVANVEKKDVAYKGMRGKEETNKEEKEDKGEQEKTKETCGRDREDKSGNKKNHPINQDTPTA